MTKAKTETRAVAISSVDLSSYVAVSTPAQEIAELFTDNFGGEKLDVFSLTTIKVPSGGAQQWEIPTLDGQEYDSTIQGVIVGIQKSRSYWAQGLDDGDGSAPPDCQSPDLETGVGAPGGLCDLCPFNAWGSAGAGKACKEKWKVFVLRETSLLPVVVDFPPTSLRAMNRYRLALTEQNLRIADVVTAFSLEREKSNSGITYSKILLQYVGKVDENSRESLRRYTKSFSPMIAAASVKQVTAAQPTHEGPLRSFDPQKAKEQALGLQASDTTANGIDHTGFDDPWSEDVDMETSIPSQED